MPGPWCGARIGVGSGRSVCRMRRRTSMAGLAYIQVLASVAPSACSPSREAALAEVWRRAVSRPSASAPSVTVCRVVGWWPQDVYI